MNKPFQQKPQFKARAIETRYDGYKFRSRLEARYATFFNTLKIPYIYEMEGYALEGTPYLPDFYLPQHDCFIEIKGVEPTPDEIRKARLLCLYTMKRVFIFAGEVGIDKYGRSAYGFKPPLMAYTSPTGIKDKPISDEAFWTIQRLSDAGLSVSLNKRKDDLILKQEKTWEVVDEDIYTWEDICAEIAEQGESSLAAMDLLKRHHWRVQEAIEPEPDQIEEELIWIDIDERFNYAWGECLNCSAITITNDEHSYQPCKCKARANYDAPRILSAYATAREARF